MTNHPVDVGRRTEAVVLAELVKRGHRVLIPFGVNHRYDLLLDLGERFVRVQCKTGKLKRGVIRFKAESVRSNTRNVLRRSYGGEADLFLVHCPQNNRIYAVPVGESPTTLGSLRIDPPANGQAKRIVWATDYELPA